MEVNSKNYEILHRLKSALKGGKKMKLSELKKYSINYDWKTIYVGVGQFYFNFETISEYAVTLMEEGNDDFIAELTWNIDSSNVQESLEKIKMRYFPKFTESSDDYKFEERKLRYVYLEGLDRSLKNKEELLDKIAEYYDNHNYPIEISSFINYMPQDIPTTTDDLIKNFHGFLDTEYKILKGI
ncbi:DUF2247 family protein [Xylocopilactobacillus apicola]|uniref:DUF4304 domain-containing protein n=1 Tax=Xylocopilactobacillus apicola TaxID=2932184 RepID=A0AAU9DEQ6_9LACO|nr:DUF2247 family protein [Xylocopilactobacillus apicola]BDR59372.1 hypothetical protein XA3_18130 [Xylocopilactobacillus apicola]